jgi:hypothetical protein
MAKKSQKTTKALGPTTLMPFSTAADAEQMARKAYELYQQRGAEHGRDLEDWFLAERLIHDALHGSPLSESSLEGRRKGGLPV